MTSPLIHTKQKRLLRYKVYVNDLETKFHNHKIALAFMLSSEGARHLINLRVDQKFRKN